ncbi:putative amidohydrolase family protein [Diplodia seriata]|uniref:6-methylsalicylate decarboxylase n=1 Tax=Diplodia seriata TaxID=420778 RepID=A0A0G2E2I2_9PEZI|nr:putative amidohydrolase family protein [Diplodia seriata]
MLPPGYVKKWNESSGIPKGLTLPAWSTEIDLEFMDRNGIEASILSLSAPGLAFVKSPDEALQLCRWVNEYAAEIKAANPSRFGFFATLPPPEPVGPCIEELRYTLDVLEADGVTLLSSYNDKYLGHPAFRPLWQELDRRNAVVFVHPTFAQTWGASSDPTIPRPIVDFPHETTRTAVNLVTSNTVRDFPNCKIILSHGGGTLPYVATRIANQTADLGLKEKSADDFLRDTKRFYYDLALTGYEGPVEAVVKFADEGHVLYGSDFPFARERTIVPQIANIQAASMDEETRLSIDHGAARQLFPRFSK